MASKSNRKRKQHASNIEKVNRSGQVSPEGFSLNEGLVFSKLVPLDEMIALENKSLNKLLLTTVHFFRLTIRYKKLIMQHSEKKWIEK